MFFKNITLEQFHFYKHVEHVLKNIGTVNQRMCQYVFINFAYAFISMKLDILQHITQLYNYLTIRKIALPRQLMK